MTAASTRLLIGTHVFAAEAEGARRQAAGIDSLRAIRSAPPADTWSCPHGRAVHYNGTPEMTLLWWHWLALGLILVGLEMAASGGFFAISQLAQTTLRSEVGKIDLDNTFEERTNINTARATPSCCRPTSPKSAP
jgi:hypothetical protein